MHFRSILSGTLALLLLSGVRRLPASSTGQPADSGFSFHLPKLGLSSIFGEKKKPDQQQIAQQSDGTTATGLEEQLRQMNGKIEELNFQVLQMQEQIRKQQEDNEFRFQQLEGELTGRSRAGRRRRNRTPRQRPTATSPRRRQPGAGRCGCCARRRPERRGCHRRIARRAIPAPW